jgi:FAD/FMN-containing dehydrogenase
MIYRYTPLQIEKLETLERLSKSESDSLISKENTVTNLDFKSLESQVTGRIVYPSSPTYNDAKRDFNSTYSANPLLIVYVANYGDIRSCLEFARKFNILTTIRSGGHSVACYSVSDGMVIDISGLKSIFVNPEELTAEVQAGNTFGDINPVLAFYGLHVPGGECPTVSVAGYMQGGGYGVTSRTFGMNIDCVLEVTVMLADGSVVIANKDQNQDLFWAIRGGTGGNFGVLLNIKYKLFPLTGIWGLRIEWDFEDDNTNAATAMHTVQEIYLKEFKHPELGIQLVLLNDNLGDGRKKLYFAASFIGTEAELDTTIAPLLAISGSKITLKEYASYEKINADVLEGVPSITLPDAMTLGGISRSTYFEKSLSIEDYSEILTFFKTTPGKYNLVGMECYGGVINQQPIESAAFIHRNVTMDFFCDVFFLAGTPEQTENENWLESFYSFLRKFDNGHSYQNYPNRKQTDFQWAYWGEYYDQLCSIKLKYNPLNFFEYQQSIGQPLTSHREVPQIRLFDSNTPIIREKY